MSAITFGNFISHEKAKAQEVYSIDFTHLVRCQEKILKPGTSWSQSFFHPEVDL